MKKIYKNFAFDLIISLSALLLGIIMLPPFGIGKYALNVMLSATIIVYFIVYLWDKLRKTKGSIFLLTMTECMVYFFIIADLILGQFAVVSAISVCRALGIFFWTRGASSALGMYINALAGKFKKNNLLGFMFRIAMISFGTFLVAHPLITDTVLNWGLCTIFFISALTFGGLALLFAPIKEIDKDVPAAQEEEPVAN